MLTANLNTSCPFIITKFSLFFIVSSSLGFLLPPAGTLSIISSSPSAPIESPKKPYPSSTCPTIAAAAPSPNSTQVFLFCISIILDKVSAPITSTFLYRPDLTNEYATSKPYIKPVQAAFKSKQGIDVNPNLFCTIQAAPCAI